MSTTKRQAVALVNANTGKGPSEIMALAQAVASNRGWNGAVRASFLNAVETAVCDNVANAVSALARHFGK